ncbi:hypothetical protein QWY87_04990 [Lutimonas halocynthiae]|uniref:hypothetical protein n=1 Tax=Lutimonas halocynthiae TaxID=1446477 RepID=UPI0025B5329E|nr:hypothetical protein [Lutimonas halocynthiae]MDN3642044.1 hypothetical protein [Lutimonas halocynthiae]
MRKVALNNKEETKGKSMFYNHIMMLALFIGFLFINTISIRAQSQDDENTKKWNFVAAPYLLLPTMQGDVAINDIPIEVDASTGDIFNVLEGGFMLFFEASNSKWAVNMDILYMKLGETGETPILGRIAELEIKQLGLTFNGLYRVAPWAEVGIGGRFNSIEQSAEIAPGEVALPGRFVSMKETWFDPLLVARVMTRFDGSQWRLGMLADIGGFGVGSDLAWQINPFVGYQFSKLFEIDLAYRWLSMDYESGADSNYFKYDMLISGPEIGFLFHF